MVKVIKATGLLPVFEPKNASHIFGVTPGVAGEGVLNGTLVLVDIPDHIETFDVHVPEIDEDEGDKPKKSAKSSAEGQDGPVEIPDGWEDQHWMKNDKLAKQIAGDKYLLPDGTKATDYNETIIREEIQRRADAKDAGEGNDKGTGSTPNASGANDAGGEGGPLKTSDVNGQQQ